MTGAQNIIPNQFLTHITKQGERWDSIAYHYYGDALAYDIIVMANQQVAITDVLPAGLILSIPLIKNTIETEDLPPWLT